MSSIVVLLPEELKAMGGLAVNTCKEKDKTIGLVTLSRWLVTETLIKPEYGEVAGSIPMTTEIKRILLRTLQPIA
ncbi:hypothetical protein RIR_jg15460.t1 [Rhizophagus irregularis DAOM 181602=DAOM 197198]|nr:hypothetical protein RIR_jg15460.t1 [Rhizophagus irregularis DAOM 181602=DAOM 197198]